MGVPNSASLPAAGDPPEEGAGGHRELLKAAQGVGGPSSGTESCVLLLPCSPSSLQPPPAAARGHLKAYAFNTPDGFIFPP